MTHFPFPFHHRIYNIITLFEHVQDSNWNLYNLESPFELYSPIVAFKLREVVVSDWHALNRTHTAFISCGPCTSKLRKSVEPQVQQVKNIKNAEIVWPVFLLSAYQAACSDASAHLQTVRKKHQQKWYAKVFCKAAIVMQFSASQKRRFSASCRRRRKPRSQATWAVGQGSLRKWRSSTQTHSWCQ